MATAYSSFSKNWCFITVIFWLVLTLCGCGGGPSISSNSSQPANPPTEPAGQVGTPWSFRFVSSSGSSANSLTVDANLIQSSGGISTAAIQVQGACVSPTLASESIIGTLVSTPSLTVTYGGVTMLLTGTLAADGNSLSGTYTMSGECGNDNGRWAGFKVADVMGNYSGFLQAADSFVPNGSIQGNFTIDANYKVSGNFGSSVSCFSNLAVLGMQIGAQISGTGAGGSAKFSFESNDAAFDSMTGSLIINQACAPFGNGPAGATFTLTNGQEGTAGGVIAVPNLAPVLTSVSPTKTTSVALSGVNVLGINFTSKSQVLLDGMPAYVTSLISPGFLSASMMQVIGQGTHLVSVTDSGATSNVLPLTVYVSAQGPQPFLSPSMITSGNETGPISIADVNGDGIPDLFISTFGAAGKVFLGRGDGTFQFAGSTPPNAFMIADLNGDGLAELIGYDGNQLLIWSGNGDPTFSSSPLTISPFPLVGWPPIVKVADIDGDGHLDLIARGTIFFGRGNLQFDVVQTSFGDPLVVGDFNNDGKLDIFTGTATFLNNGNRTFTSIPSRLNSSLASDAVAADFNGDGILDLATSESDTSSGGMLLIDYGCGDGTFYVQGQIVTADRISSIAVGDFNGDGRPDVVTGFSTTPQIGVFTNDGQGGFQVSNAPSGGIQSQIVNADFNKDGKPDLVVLNTYSSNVWILLTKLTRRP